MATQENLPEGSILLCLLFTQYQSVFRIHITTYFIYFLTTPISQYHITLSELKNHHFLYYSVEDTKMRNHVPPLEVYGERVNIIVARVKYLFCRVSREPLSQLIVYRQLVFLVLYASWQYVLDRHSLLWFVSFLWLRWRCIPFPWAQLSLVLLLRSK